MQYFRLLFEAGLQEMYAAEKQILQALPALIQTATEPKLRETLRLHLEETEQQIFRLEEIADEYAIHWEETSVDVMQALLQKGEQCAMMGYPSYVKDAAIIAAMQCVEHYEIAVYGTLREFARILNFDFAEKRLSETSKEEGKAEKKLGEIAGGTLFSTGVNKKACHEVCV